MSVESMLQILLLNYLFILIVTVTSLLLLDRNVLLFSSLPKRRIFIFFGSSLSILFCIFFPISLTSNFQFDLRMVPMILGGLYGGPLVSIGLYIVTVTARSFIEGDGIMSTFITTGVFLIFAGMLSNRFILYSSKKRILVGSIFVSVSPLFVYIVSYLVWNFHIPLNLMFFGIIFSASCALLTILIIEFMVKHFIVNDKIIHAKKLEMVSSMAASVSHEIRNPLTTTKGFLQLLEETEVDATRLQYFELSLAELERAESIINGFLTFAKPTLHHFVPLNIKKDIEKLLEIISPMANMNSVNIQTDLSDIQVLGDEKLFRQALLNIVKNSIEAMPSGGVLRIKAKQTSKGVVISISDTGVGMSADQIQRIGEPYFTTKDQNGTGLGMMVTYRILQLMKGRVYVQSQLGEGTCFTLVFPPLTAIGAKVQKSETANSI
ncbi:ATP-binding protein [Bacillus spongiae]|uniref:histidine kinase n=1 Tax=Bacillus spongiae TaxID=2683610 RepID=A0ABU8HGA6_9BACI